MQRVEGRTLHWPELTQKVPTSLHNILGSLGGFCDRGARDDVAAFFAKNPPGEGERALRRSLEAILSWDFDRVIVTHGHVLESGGRARLEQAFAFLRR